MKCYVIVLCAHVTALHPYFTPFPVTAILHILITAGDLGRKMHAKEGNVVI